MVQQFSALQCGTGVRYSPVPVCGAVRRRVTVRCNVVLWYMSAVQCGALSVGCLLIVAVVGCWSTRQQQQHRCQILRSTPQQHRFQFLDYPQETRRDVHT